jgi:hypothetical protein
MMNAPRGQAHDLDRRGSPILAFLVLVLASLAVASVAHVAISMLDAAGLGSNAYGTYEHSAVVPILFAVFVLAGAVVSLAVAKRVARRSNVDPVTALLRSVGRSATASTLAVTGGGTAALVAMEFFEQTQSLGHIAGFAAALGGIPIVGIAIVAAAAVVVVGAGLAALHFIVGAAINAAIEFIAWVAAVERAGTRRAIMLSRPALSRVAAVACAAQNLGSRPPPARV